MVERKNITVFELTEKMLSEPILVYRSPRLVLPEGPVTTHALNERPLPFKDFQFACAVSTYTFFSTQQAIDESVAELQELARVAKEVRLAPLHLQETQVNAVLGPIVLALQQLNYGVEIKADLLRIWPLVCVVS